MTNAFRSLDAKLKVSAQILIGGGAAMIFAHNVNLSTMDIDGLLINTPLTASELDPLVKKVAKELKINPHWFNSYFNTFTYTIPPDYKERLISIYKGKNLEVLALGLEDLLIMKCFSGREKDIGHAKALIKRGANLKFVEDHIERLKSKGVPNGGKALDFFDDIREQEGV